MPGRPRRAAAVVALLLLLPRRAAHAANNGGGGGGGADGFRGGDFPLCSSPPYVDIRTVPPDLVVPPLLGNASAPVAPAPGTRTYATLPGWPSPSAAYYSLYLPTDFSATRVPPFPVLIELPGNGPYESPYGDISTGRPEQTFLGYGLTAGRGAVWAALPMLTAGGDFDQLTWWGCASTAPAGEPPAVTPPGGGCGAATNISASVRYIEAAVAHIVARYNGDASRVAIAGFSRGAIGVNYLGLADDRVAGLWRASVAYAHYDGQPEDAGWPYPDAGPPASFARLKRLGARPQYIVSELNVSLAMTKPYIASSGLDVNATFASTGFCNHNSAWALRPSPARNNLRAWWQRVVVA
jgi:hypothetical protein